MRIDDGPPPQGPYDVFIDKSPVETGNWGISGPEEEWADVGPIAYTRNYHTARLLADSWQMREFLLRLIQPCDHAASGLCECDFCNATHDARAFMAKYVVTKT